MKLMKRSTKDGAPWYAVFWETLPSGQKKQRWKSTGTPEKRVAKEIAAKLLTEAAMRSRGLVDSDAERFKREAKRSIESHLEDFKPLLQSRHSGKNATRNVNGKLNYVRGFCAFAGITSIAEITADSLNRYIVALSEQDKGARTIGAMVGACKHFTSWLRKHQKLKVDPLETVTAPDANSDRRLSRRMLKPAEWEWLIRATLAGPVRYEMLPSDRGLLYRLAIQTGLRSGEIVTLTRGSFVLDAQTPYVKVASGDTKNTRAAHQYIDQRLASDLRSHLSTKLPAAPAFNLPYDEAAKMLREDLQAARKLWLADAKNDPAERSRRESTDFLNAKNDAGDELDFHALRHTCGAWLAMRGVQPKVIQSVMRHSTIVLTMDTYGHLIEGAESAAVSSTADLTAVPDVLASQELANNVLTNTVREACGAVRSLAAGAEISGSSEKAKKPLNPGESAASCGVMRAGAKRRARDSNPQLGEPATDFESAPDVGLAMEIKGEPDLANNVLTNSVLGRAGPCESPETSDRALADLLALWHQLNDEQRTEFRRLIC